MIKKYWLFNTITALSAITLFSASIVALNPTNYKKATTNNVAYAEIFPKVALKDNAKLLSKPSLIKEEDIMIYHLQLEAFKHIKKHNIILNPNDKKQSLEVILIVLNQNTNKLETYKHTFKFLDTISPAEKFTYTMINFLKDKTFDLKESLKRTYQDDSSAISVFEAQQNLIIRDKDNNVIPETELPFKEITNITNIEHLANKQLKLKNISFKDKDNNIYTFTDYTNIININLKNSNN